MASARSTWLWLGLAAAVIAAGTVTGILLLGGEDREQVQAPRLPEGVGIDSDVRFTLITGQCGYEVVVTAETTVDPQNGEFCLVRLDVRNSGDAPRSLDPSCQYLIDSSGARHDQRDDVLPLDEVSTQLFEEELAPDEGLKDAGLYYDVPKGTEAAAVEVHAACDSPGVRIPIPA